MSRDDIKHPTPNNPDHAWMWILAAVLVSIAVSRILVPPVV